MVYAKRDETKESAMTIELSDEQAAAQGLTLEAWLQKLAAVEGPSRPHKSRYTLSELMMQCDLDAPLSAEDSAWLDAPSVGREA
jgi:hypothetical protein